MTGSDKLYLRLLGLPEDQRAKFLACLSAAQRAEILEQLRLDSPVESLETQVVQSPQLEPTSDELARGIPGADYSLAADPLKALMQIGPFVIRQEIGRGAMGIVYRAVRSSDNREVALKLISPETIASEVHRKMFAREAKLLKALRHKRIVDCIDFGYHHRQFFLAMEYVKCVRWENVFRSQSRRKQIRLACGIVSYVLEALQFAHDQSVVHRDIKPGNILTYMEQGRLKAKVADFGLAKNFDSAGLSTFSRDTDTKGTLAYMAPEQIENARYAGPSCDLYSAGTCLYFYLTGTTPYSVYDRGNFVQYVDAKRSKQPAPIRSAASDISVELADIVNRSLARNPTDRFASADEMREALARFSM